MTSGGAWARLWLATAGLCFWLGWSAAAQGHDLAIDQLMLWPDTASGRLLGELTLDPELTRSKDAAPSAEHAARLLELLERGLTLSLDGRPVSIDFEVRELWTRGGATLGDLVVFSTPLGEVGALELSTRPPLGALVVSVQQTEAGGVTTASWLLGAGERTPAYRLGAGAEQPGWRLGGPELFAAPAGDGAPSAAAEQPVTAASPWQLARQFVRLGFEHVLPLGLDHVLFVAGLTLGSRRLGRAVLSLSLFTLAHTLTLGLASVGWVRVPGGWVEPLIGLSLVVLGLDNLRPSGARRGATGRGRELLVFLFGLVHGLGFAGALAELAFDREHLLLSLLAFNAGVELGQLAVVSLVAALLLALPAARRRVTLVASAAIAAAGLFITFDRVWPADSRAAEPPSRPALEHAS